MKKNSALVVRAEFFVLSSEVYDVKILHGFYISVLLNFTRQI